MSSSIIPSHKSDLAAVERLTAAPDAEVIPVLPELLAWLQDINWPVARGVLERLAVFEGELVAPVRDILQGDDGFWKYWILSALLPRVRTGVVHALIPELQRLVDAPTQDDRFEEVHLAAAELLTERD